MRNAGANLLKPGQFRLLKILTREGSDGRLHTLTILLPHDQTDVDGQEALNYLAAHVSTVGAVERLTGTDFFPNFSGRLVERRRLWDVSGASFSSLVEDPCPSIAGATIQDGTPRVFVLP